MSAEKTQERIANWQKVRDEWIAAVNELIAQVESWCQEQDWPTRRADKEMEDSEIGNYTVPMLMIQNWDVRLLLEPVARSTVGSDGVVDLYCMPAYDDIAHLYRERGKWHMLLAIPNGNGITKSRNTKSRPFAKSQFIKVVQALRAQHAQA